MKTRIGLAAAAAAALAAFPAEAGMFKAKGFEPAVYYTGERPIERGDAVADLGILYIHGWGGGADVTFRLDAATAAKYTLKVDATGLRLGRGGFMLIVR
jgi:hypothetical protein